MKRRKTIIVMPAYNASRTLARTIADIPFDYVDEVLLVDDASLDGTVDTARQIVASHPRLTMSADEYARDPHKVLFTIERHERNLGYGGNQKTCYRLALAHGADIVVMLHPDYQYDPRLVKYFVGFIEDGYFDVMLGSRIRTRKEALAGGMPAYKYFANRALTLMQNIASGQALSEWHTGMRAYTREVLEAIGYERFSNDFVFDTQALFAIVEHGYSMGDIPAPVRYFSEASSINFSRSVRYGVLTVWETAKFVYRNSARVFRYLVAGVLAVAANLLAYALLLFVLHMPYLLAAFIAFWTGAIVSFTLQKFWTFAARSASRIHYELAVYLLLITLNSFANTALLAAFVHVLHAPPLLANVGSNAVVALWSFFVYREIAFKQRGG